jgi:hypothetical protein
MSAHILASLPPSLPAPLQEFCDLGTLRDALNKRRHGLDPEAPAFPLLAAQLALDIANGMR